VHNSARGAKACGGGSGSRVKHVQLNRDVMAAAKSGDDEQLCTLVAKQWQDFDAVNAATAYQKLLLMRTARHTRLQQDAGHAPLSARDKMLAILKPVLCEQHIPVFSARLCANMLHTLAKIWCRQPCTDMLRALEARVLAVCGDFEPQHVANILWAFVTLRHQPSKELVGGLQVRAVALRIDFIPQAIANTLWAFAALRLPPNEALVAGLIERAVVVQDDFNDTSTPRRLPTRCGHLRRWGCSPARSSWQG